MLMSLWRAEQMARLQLRNPLRVMGTRRCQVVVYGRWRVYSQQFLRSLESKAQTELSECVRLVNLVALWGSVASMGLHMCCTHVRGSHSGGTSSYAASMSQRGAFGEKPHKKREKSWRITNDR